MLSWFFSSVDFADRYIRRELGVVSLENLSIVEYQTQTIF